MSRCKTLIHVLQIAKVSINESGIAFLSLKKNVNRTSLRFCSSEGISSGNSDQTPSVLDPVENLDLTDYTSKISKNFNFAMVADKSPLIQKFIDLGVNLHEIEKNPAAANFLLTLNFEKIKPYLFFLTDNGVPTDKLGQFITKNSTIFKEDLDDLEVRINYLKSKKFDNKMISEIITKFPKWLSVPVRQIDERLGYLQVTFNLKGDQVRQMITRVPSLATIKKEIIMMNTHALKEELDLDKHALKKLIVSQPQLLRINSFDLVATYEYLTKTMKVSKALIVNQPKVLCCRRFILEERHRFLESLGRAQYCHLLPGYVNLKNLVETKDDEFCEKIARTSKKLFHDFLKTF